MTFKLGSENRKTTYGSGKNRFSKDDASIPGTPVLRKDLPKGIKGEANNDGSIFISNEIQPGSDEERKVLMHEMRHIVDMKRIFKVNAKPHSKDGSWDFKKDKPK